MLNVLSLLTILSLQYFHELLQLGELYRGVTGRLAESCCLVWSRDAPIASLYVSEIVQLVTFGPNRKGDNDMAGRFSRGFFSSCHTFQVNLTALYSRRSTFKRQCVHARLLCARSHKCMALEYSDRYHHVEGSFFFFFFFCFPLMFKN